MPTSRRSPERAATPPPPSLAFLVMALGRHARDLVEQGLAPSGLTYRHLSALGHLNADAGISYSALGRRVGVTAQSMQTTVAHLEEIGAVRRLGTPSQGRRAELQVTARGRSLLAKGRAVMAAVDEHLWADVDPSVRADVLDALGHGLSALATESSPTPPR